MGRKERPESSKTEHLEETLNSFGTSRVQMESLLKNFDAGKMCQHNHHIEFLSPNSQWFMRLTKIGKVDIYNYGIEIEMPTGVHHSPIEKESREGKIIIENQVESGDIVLEIYPFDKEKGNYFYQSVTANTKEFPDFFVPIEKFFNLTKILMR